MKDFILTIILHDNMTVEFKNGINQLNAHQAARQFIYVELSGFTLSEDETLHIAFEQGEVLHVNPEIMELDIEKKVYKKQIPKIVRDEPGEWRFALYVKSNWNESTGTADYAYPSGKYTFYEHSTIADDGTVVPSESDLVLVWNETKKNAETALNSAERAEEAYDRLINVDLPNKYVTVDTNQTISGNKTHTGINTFNGFTSINGVGIDADAIVKGSDRFKYPVKSGTLALTSDIPENIVTTDTNQTIDGTKAFTSPITVGGQTWHTVYMKDSFVYTVDGNNYEVTYPEKSGTMALKSDIPTDYVTQKEFEDVNRDISDIYTIIGETVYLLQPLTQAYTSRETAAGMEIIDGALTTVQTIEGSTVKTINQFSITNLANTDYLTVSGKTITVTNRYDCNSLKTLRQLCPDIHAGTYTASVNVSANTDLSNASGTIALYSSDGLLYLLPQHTAGQLKNVFTLSNADLDRPVYFFGMSEGTVTWDKLMVLEGDWTDKEIPAYQPYFKGLKNAYFKSIVSTGKNLIPYPYAETTKTAYGITFTVNADGTITANGTATDNTSFLLCNRKIKLNGTYTLGGAAGGSSTTYYIQINTDKSWHGAATNGQTETFDNEAVVSITIFIKTGMTLNNFVFKPMLNFGTTAEPYEPYKQSVLSLASAVENPAYNTLDFQTGKNVSQGNTMVFDGTEAWILYTPPSGSEEAGYTIFTRNMFPFGASGSIESICNKYPYKAYGYNLSTSGTCQSFSSEGKTLFIKQNQYSTVEEFKAYLAAQYAAGDPLIVRYKTVEIQSETELNADYNNYQAWNGGSETVVQGDIDNSEYGAENTVSQEYPVKRGGTI